MFFFLPRGCRNLPRSSLFADFPTTESRRIAEFMSVDHDGDGGHLSLQFAFYQLLLPPLLPPLAFLRNRYLVFRECIHRATLFWPQLMYAESMNPFPLPRRANPPREIARSIVLPRVSYISCRYVEYIASISRGISRDRKSNDRRPFAGSTIVKIFLA